MFNLLYHLLYYTISDIICSIGYLASTVVTACGGTQGVAGGH